MTAHPITAVKAGNEKIQARAADHLNWLHRGQTGHGRFQTEPGEDLSGMHLPRANLGDAYFNGATLDGAVLSHAVLHRVDFASASARSANLRAADLTGSIWTSANLESADLTGAQMAEAHLFQANLNTVRADEAKMTRANLGNATLRGATLKGANLTGAHLAGADLTGADLRLAELEGVNIERAVLRRVRGLWGNDRAIGKMQVQKAEWAVYGRRCDLATWEVLRVLAGLRLLSASYFVLIAIIIYAGGIRWANAGIESWHEWASEHGEGATAPGAALVSRIPLLPVDQHLARLLIAVVLLALGNTFFMLRCPGLVRENSETRWTMELGHPLVTYRAAKYSRGWQRYVTLVALVFGGGYTLGFLIWKTYAAIAYLLTAA